MSNDQSKIRYSVIGTGKTGGAVADVLGGKATLFNQSNKPTPEALRQTDIAVIFVPGSAASEIVPVVLESEIPAIWGTTGYKWPEDLPELVKDAKSRWVIGSNFSLGMNLVRKAIQIIGKGSELLNNPSFHIHEVHHIHKEDAPSGTALAWQNWLGRDANISSDRQGDVNGIHNLYVKTVTESISLKHEAHSRELFAEGAIWAANYLIANPYIDSGVYSFSDLFDKAFNN